MPVRTGPVVQDTTTIALGLAQIRIGDSASNIATTSAVLTASDSIGALADTSYTGESEFFNLESGFPLTIDAKFPLRESNILECSFKEITPKNFAIARGINPLAAIDSNALLISSVTTAGTTTGISNIVTTNAGGVVTETVTIVFSSASAYDAYGTVSGHIGSGTVSAQFAPDNGGNPYFTIPADYFTGTWAADETYTFATTAYIAGTSAYANAHSGSIALGNIVAPAYLRVEAVYTFPNGSNTLTFIFPRANVTSTANLALQAEDAAAVPITITSTGADSNVSGGNAVWDSMPSGQIVWG